MSDTCTSGVAAQPGQKPKPYQRRYPERTPAYQAVQQHLETWLVRQQEADPGGIGIPAYVERDLRNFLQCGILAYGFARARCEGCGHDFLVAFRSALPAKLPLLLTLLAYIPVGNTRRMEETAAHLIDDALPEAPLRQSETVDCLPIDNLELTEMLFTCL